MTISFPSLSASALISAIDDATTIFPTYCHTVTDVPDNHGRIALLNRQTTICYSVRAGEQGAELTLYIAVGFGVVKSNAQALEEMNLLLTDIQRVLNERRLMALEQQKPTTMMRNYFTAFQKLFVGKNALR